MCVAFLHARTLPVLALLNQLHRIAFSSHLTTETTSSATPNLLCGFRPPQPLTLDIMRLPALQHNCMLTRWGAPRGQGRAAQPPLLSPAPSAGPDS